MKLFCVRICGRRGFTLIELIMAIAVFVVGVVTVLPFFSSALRLLGDTHQKLTATQLASSRMAEIEAEGFPSSLPTDSFDVPFAAPHEMYTHDIVWAPVANDILDAAKPIAYRVELVVSWPVRGKQRQESLVTYIGKT